MKATKSFLTLLTIFLSAGIAQAQETLAEITADWERAKTYTVEYLDAMPEASYGLKPTPEMRSFAEQMLHLTGDNYALVAAAAGEKSPVDFGESEKMADKSKANVRKAVIEGYDYAIATIKKINPARFTEKIRAFDRFDCTRGGMLEKAFEHQTHHRGQTTVYLRLAGAKPPQEKLF